MNHLKLFEQYNKEETLLGLAKMGLRTNRREVFDLAISKFPKGVEPYKEHLKKYCIKEIINYKSLQWVTSEEEYLDIIDRKTYLKTWNKNFLFENISPLINLDELYIDNSVEILDFENIIHLKNLETFEMTGNNIEDISPLSGLTKLETLSLSANNIEDISPLSGLTRLRTVWLSKNKIKDISPLNNLKNLRRINLSQNYIKDLSPLIGLHQLSAIYVEDVLTLPGDFDTTIKHSSQSIRKFYKYLYQNHNN